MFAEIMDRLPLKLRRAIIKIGRKILKIIEFPKVREILKYYEKCDDGEINQCLDFIRKTKRIYSFNYAFINDYDPEEIVIEKDASCNMFYYVYYGKKMYLPRSFTKYWAKAYVNSILMEQDEKSPHRYLTPDIAIGQDDVVFDIGAAEGNFSLFLIDKVKKVVLFESDAGWIEALKKTFENYGEKCQIVNRFVGKGNAGNELSLDDFVHETGIVPTVIKMDIEGGELSAIEGGMDIIENSAGLKMFLCTYHSYDAEEEMRKKLRDMYDIEMSSGYMIWTYGDEKWKAPYFKRGILRAVKK